MNLFLQFGYGMMSHCLELLKNKVSDGVILSPRDLNSDQLVRMGKDIKELKGTALLDPQCFVHDADWHTLKDHKYFKIFQSNATGAFIGGPATADLLTEIFKLGDSIGVSKYILPGLIADPVSEDWFALQENIINEATSIAKKPLILTIALSDSALKSEEQIEAIIERATTWNVAGFYLIAETPSSYLVDDPNWVANFLILSSGLKLLGKEVIVGYCNHQMLCLGAANVDTICSGTWLNVRAFPTSKFYTPAEDEVSRRAVWYYCPQALSEYKLPMLDMAYRAGIISNMKPDPSLGSKYATPLFSSAQPTSISWGEQNAFRHYLTCLNAQVSRSKKTDFEKTYNDYLSLLDVSEKIVANLRKNAVLGADRDFKDYFDVNRSAMIVFSNARKHRLKKIWK